MSGSLLALIVIPVVVLAALAVWLIPILRVASRRPRAGPPGGEPVQKILGGIFHGYRRQHMPHFGAPARQYPPGTVPPGEQPPPPGSQVSSPRGEDQG